MAKQQPEFEKALNYAMAELERVGDLAKLPVPVRIVIRIHAAQGIIDNGGLQYFFESDFPDQPNYSIFVNAYRAIGAKKEAAALAKAVKLFRFRSPHKQRERRNEFLDKFQEGGGHRADSPFEPYTNQLCGNKRVWQLLASYIAKHAAVFPV